MPWSHEKTALTARCGNGPGSSIAIVVVWCFLVLLSPDPQVLGQTYWDRENGFSMTFPEGWTLFEKKGTKPVVGAKSSKGDRIIVTIDPLAPKYRGKYKNIIEIPGYAAYTKDVIVKGLRGYLLDSGTMDLSNRKALWNRFALIHTKGSGKRYLIIYQVQALKKDRVYSITVTVGGGNRAEALKRYTSLRHILKKSIASFHLDP